MDRAVRLAPLVLWIAAAAGCPNGLPEPPVRPTDAGAPVLQVEPDAALDGTPRVVRIRVSGLELGDSGAGIAVFDGPLTSSDLGRIRRGELGAPLTARRVQALEYEDGADRMLAPLAVLVPGETYSVVDGAGELIGSFVVSARAPAPLQRLWPPVDGGSGVEHVVYCGEGGCTDRRRRRGARTR